MNQFIQRIEEKGITPEIVMDMIADHEKEAQRMQRLYKRYKSAADGVPILRRRPFEVNVGEKAAIEGFTRIDDKVDNRLANPFDVEIVDTKIGYFLGHPITYEYDDKRNPGTSSPIKQKIDEFNLRNHVEDEDSELGKMASICGQAARLIYIEKGTGFAKLKNLNPWEVIFLGDNISEPKYSLWYYKDYKGLQRAEFYDNTNEIHFTSDDNAQLSETSRKEHMFQYNPLIGLANNKELMGDAERVLTLIDAYNRTLSDASNEIEQYRLAYLVLKGMTAGDGTEDDMKRGKIIELLGEHDDVSYLTKDINDDLIEHHLDRLEANIIRLSKSVNFNDDSFAGQSSGVALKYKLQALENKTITMERKLVSTLRTQFRVLFSAWSTSGPMKAEDYLKVWFGFKRNLPANILEEAQASAQLKGLVSEETRLSKLSIVDDVAFEIQRMQEEQAEMDEYRNNQYPLEGDNVDANATGD